MKPINQLFLCLILFSVKMSFSQNVTLDASFNGNGKVATVFGVYDSAVSSMALQRDGKVIAGGTVFNHGSYSQIGLARYLENGSLDPEFGNEGKVVSSFSDYKMSLNTIVLANNGDIIGAGIIYNNYTDSQFFLVKYDKNGKLDEKFGANGIIIKNNLNVNSLTVQSDGKIIAAGFSFDQSNRDFMLMRFIKNGKLDPTFGDRGIVTSSIGDRDLGYDVAVQSNGKIILTGTIRNSSGSYNTDAVVMRFTKKGILDDTFGTNGITLIDDNDVDGIRSVKIQSDNKILFTAWSGSPYSFYLGRLLANGKLDTDFGVNGKSITEISIGDSKEAIEVQKDGKIIIAGSVEKFGGTDIALARYDAFGKLDASFGKDGYLITPFNTVSRANSIKLQDDEYLIIGGEAGTTQGTYNPDFALLKYNLGFATALINRDDLKILANKEFNENKNPFKVYSNPYDNAVNLDFNLTETEVLSIDLYDINGKKVKEIVRNRTFENGSNNLKIELPDSLSNGIYILNISNNKSTYNIKIIK